MLPVVAAKNAWMKTTEPDRQLMEEHEKRLGRCMQASIDSGHEYLEYEIPWVLYGPWPVFDVNEVCLELMKRARRKGYCVQLQSLSPPCIKVSGWAPHSPYLEAIDHNISKPTRAVKAAPPPTLDMSKVKRGTLSSRLRMKLSSL